MAIRHLVADPQRAHESFSKGFPLARAVCGLAVRRVDIAIHPAQTTCIACLGQVELEVKAEAGLGRVEAGGTGEAIDVGSGEAVAVAGGVPDEAPGISGPSGAPKVSDILALMAQFTGVPEIHPDAMRWRLGAGGEDRDGPLLAAISDPEQIARVGDLRDVADPNDRRFIAALISFGPMSGDPDIGRLTGMLASMLHRAVERGVMAGIAAVASDAEDAEGGAEGPGEVDAVGAAGAGDDVFGGGGGDGHGVSNGS